MEPLKMSDVKDLNNYLHEIMWDGSIKPIRLLKNEPINDNNLFKRGDGTWVAINPLPNRCPNCGATKHNIMCDYCGT